LGDREGAVKPKENMDVVFYSADLDWRTIDAPQDSANVFVQSRPHLSNNGWIAMLCAEDSVDDDVGEGLRHAPYCKVLAAL